ncbi:MAG: hypothetical protein QXO22_08100 [Thermosphaera sp.]
MIDIDLIRRYIRTRYVVVERRPSSSYYSYVLHLIDLDRQEQIDCENYGDMSYWEQPNEEKSFDEAYNELLKRNNIDDKDITFISYSDDNVPFELWYELVAIIFKQSY